MAAALICSCLSSAAAFAADWSATSTQSETVEFNDNQFLSSKPLGATFNSFSTITANATARTTPTSFFAFDGNFSYRKYWGGLAAGQFSEYLNGGIKLHYEEKGKVRGDRAYLEASWNTQSTAFALLGELGIVTRATGVLDRTTAVGGIDRWITANDFLSLSARGTYTNFDPGGGGTPFTDTSTNVVWRHNLNSTTALTASSDAEYLNFDNAFNSRLTMLRENIGMQTSFSPLLSFVGTAGVALVKTENGIPGLSLGTNSVSTDADWTPGFITNMVLTYKMFADTMVTLAGLQIISPSLLGTLIQTTTLRAGLTHTVNSHTTLSFATDVNRQTYFGTTTKYFSASMAYNYTLTREWSARLSYRFLHRFESSGTLSTPALTTPVVNPFGAANSNSIIATLTRSANILPDGN
jgi:hypothetical protein